MWHLRAWNGWRVVIDWRHFGRWSLIPFDGPGSSGINTKSLVKSTETGGTGRLAGSWIRFAGRSLHFVFLSVSFAPHLYFPEMVGFRQRWIVGMGNGRHRSLYTDQVLYELGSSIYIYTAESLRLPSILLITFPELLVPLLSSFGSILLFI
ncbi:hypothetical protein K469DRAFT_297604 [Zopfia rhizophila CBS 207.26]|uniref:Uncharacterized protein n=1 Tax=Zopfia rhizophila CBS 207.26 TaxID=1314779 RepID=A0A6A6DNB6_9PEZI|nr:hypothetical protein K469DRAFT_297604 [Zopfia rhizophila CBS 207.26]